MGKQWLFLTAMVNHQQKIWCIAKGRAAVAVTFTEDMKLSMKKVNFLANNINKQQFIYLLGSYLEKKCKVYHAPGEHSLSACST